MLCILASNSTFFLLAMSSSVSSLYVSLSATSLAMLSCYSLHRSAVVACLSVNSVISTYILSPSFLSAEMLWTESKSTLNCSCKKEMLWLWI